MYVSCWGKKWKWAIIWYNIIWSHLGLIILCIIREIIYSTTQSLLTIPPYRIPWSVLADCLFPFQATNTWPSLETELGIRQLSWAFHIQFAISGLILRYAWDHRLAEKPSCECSWGVQNFCQNALIFETGVHDSIDLKRVPEPVYTKQPHKQRTSVFLPMPNPPLLCVHGQKGQFWFHQTIAPNSK